MHIDHSPVVIGSQNEFFHRQMCVSICRYRDRADGGIDSMMEEEKEGKESTNCIMWLFVLLHLCTACLQCWLDNGSLDMR